MCSVILLSQVKLELTQSQCQASIVVILNIINAHGHNHMHVCVCSGQLVYITNNVTANIQITEYKCNMIYVIIKVLQILFAVTGYL